MNNVKKSQTQLYSSGLPDLPFSVFCWRVYVMPLGGLEISNHCLLLSSFLISTIFEFEIRILRSCRRCMADRVNGNSYSLCLNERNVVWCDRFWRFSYNYCILYFCNKKIIIIFYVYVKLISCGTSFFVFRRPRYWFYWITNMNVERLRLKHENAEFKFDLMWDCRVTTTGSQKEPVVCTDP